MILLLLIFGAVCFGLAFLGGFIPQLNIVPWLPLGLLFWIITAIITVKG